MISSGITTIFVSDMDRSVRFYSETLGLPVSQRFGNHWAQLEAGQLSIGLHPASPEHTSGRDGSVTIGFVLTTAIEDAMATLRTKGVKFQRAVEQDQAGKFVYFEDPDGNVLYLAELQKWAQQPTGSPHEFQNA